MIQALLIDLDDTLLADESETHRALSAIAHQFKSPNPEKFTAAAIAAARDAWLENPALEWCQMLGHSALEGLWCDYSGEDTLLIELAAWQPKFLARVWHHALQESHTKFPENITQISQSYRAERNRLHPWMPGAKEILYVLEKKLPLAILTNGISSLQWEKINRSGIRQRFSLIVVSQDFGLGKPRPEIFLHTAEKLGVSPKHCLMVGNNPASDIAGAHAAGMASCWLRIQQHISYPSHIPPPTHSITDLRQLLKIPAISPCVQRTAESELYLHSQNPTSSIGP